MRDFSEGRSPAHLKAKGALRQSSGQASSPHPSMRTPFVKPIARRLGASNAMEASSVSSTGQVLHLDFVPIHGRNDEGKQISTHRY